MSENNLVSQSKFATILGVSSTAVGKIKKQLTLVNVPGKKKPLIDLTGLKTIKYRQSREKEIKNNPEAFKYLDKKPKPKTNTKEEANNDSQDEDEDDDKNISYDLKQKNIKLKNEELQLKIDQKRNDLITKNLTDIFFGKMYQIDSDQLKQLGSKLSPKIFSVINERNKIKTNSICKLIETEDKEKKESIESILSSGEKEIKTKIVGIFEESIHSILKDIKDEIDNFLDLLEADAI